MITNQLLEARRSALQKKHDSLIADYVSKGTDQESAEVFVENQLYREWETLCDEEDAIRKAPPRFITHPVPPTPVVGSTTGWRKTGQSRLSILVKEHKNLVAIYRGRGFTKPAACEIATHILQDDANAMSDAQKSAYRKATK